VHHCDRRDLAQDLAVRDGGYERGRDRAAASQIAEGCDHCPVGPLEVVEEEYQRGTLGKDADERIGPWRGGGYMPGSR
jgi:hypothetical protein